MSSLAAMPAYSQSFCTLAPAWLTIKRGVNRKGLFATVVFPDCCHFYFKIYSATKGTVFVISPFFPIGSSNLILLTMRKDSTIRDSIQKETITKIAANIHTCLRLINLIEHKYLAIAFLLDKLIASNNLSSLM